MRMTRAHRFDRAARMVLQALGAACILFAPAISQAACQTAAHQTVQAGEVLDGQTLRLKDGREVRLSGILPPQTPRWWKKQGPWPLADVARRALAELVGSAGIELRFGDGDVQKDRHDRILAHVFVLRGEERIWAQAHLVTLGLARAASFSGQRACVRDLQRLEERARSKRIGLWRKGRFAVLPAAHVDALAKKRFSFQLVEGTVRSVATTSKWTFLNFDDDWRRDFTVAVAAKDRRRFRGSDIDLQALKGKTIRTRGWIESWNGPVIKVTHPEQIELLDSPRG